VLLRASVKVRAWWTGGAAVLAAWAATAVPAAAQAGNEPISVSVRSSLEGQKGLSRIFSSAGRGDVDDTARDVERLLGHARWLRVVSNDSEVLVTIDSRERVERRRTVDKKGKESIEHRYRAEGTVEMSRRRLSVRAEHDFTEAEYSTRIDSDQFQKVAEKLAAEISGLILSDLQELRPDRPEAGFDHAAKYKLLIKGDGLEVKGVAPGSPAEQAGLQVKDRIRRIDDEKGTDQMDSRVRTWWVEAPGTRVSLEVERNKVRQTLQLTLLPRREWGAGGMAPAASSGPAVRPAAGGGNGGSSVELRPGMTELEVVKLIGQPREKVAFGPKSLWRYDGYSVTFQNGRVVDMK
jgi:hypothetical protein